MNNYRRKTTAAVTAGMVLLSLGAAENANAIVACDFTNETFGSGTGQGGSGTPAAGSPNLTDASCAVTGLNGTTALFQIPTGPYSVGTGLIEPFLTIQEGGNESGFNTDKRVKDVTDGNGDNLDIKRAGQTGPVGFTNSLLLGQIPIVEYNGALYREILLDFNQNAGSEHLSLDVIRLFRGVGTGDLADKYTGVPKGFDTEGMVKQGTSELSLFWSLDFGQTDQTLLLDYRLCENAILGACPRGSGNTYDVRYLLPVGLFTGFSDSDYFVMYTSFGWYDCDMLGPPKKNKPDEPTERCFESNDGFEEWAVRMVEPPKVPEPGTLALLGFGLLGLGAARRWVSTPK